MTGKTKEAADDDLLPEEITRMLRRKSGFGCVVCGDPICIIGIKKEKAKTKSAIAMVVDSLAVTATAFAADCICLCQHHFNRWQEGRLSQRKLNGAVLNPHNKQIGPEDGIPFCIKALRAVGIKAGAFEVAWDGNRLLTGSGHLIILDNKPVLSLKVTDNQLLLSLNMMDADHKSLLTIKDNIIGYCSPVIQILYLKDMLTILKDNEIMLALHYHFANKVVLKEARFQMGDARVEIHGHIVTVNGVVVDRPVNADGLNRAIFNIGSKRDDFDALVHIADVKKFVDSVQKRL